ncbi:hypothetical protein QYF61_012767 [Mycteria americana]|uniref:Integrase zinc-binding domain-containing protein n=1 Tax=Mycteria americana TaxID=33587 RepID=A0AAN7NS65_MYCAM|nr:hypothetical protein QYF61_012767 [Mycteria americana]
MTQRNSLASNFINWRIPQTDKLNELTSLTNEQRRFGNGAIFWTTHHNLSQTCIYIGRAEEERSKKRKGEERRKENEKVSPPLDPAMTMTDVAILQSWARALLGGGGWGMSFISLSQQHRGKPIWAAALWQDIAAWVENLVVKVRHVDAHVPKSRATEEHQNNQQVDQAAQIEVAQVDLDWQDKGELFIAWWAHDTSGHQGRDATYRWACDRGVDLTMDTIAQVIHECETCATIKQAKLLKPFWYGGQWLKYKYGEAWQIDYVTLPQTCQGKHHVLTMVEATTGWLETYPVPHATARNTIRGLEKQVLW